MGLPRANSGLVTAALGVTAFLTFFAVMGVAFAGAAMLALGGGPGGGTSGGGGTGGTIKGDVEFMFTYYDPGQGGVNGVNCGGSHGRVCLTAGSPTGYEITEDSTGKKFTGGGAIPQPAGGGHSGSVSLSKIPLFYDHAKGTSGKGIIIPCYNEEKPFLPVDHYATLITAPNAIDLAMTADAHARFQQCLQDKKIKTSPAHNGHTAATKIKGKIVELK